MTLLLLEAIIRSMACASSPTPRRAGYGAAVLLVVATISAGCSSTSGSQATEPVPAGSPPPPRVATGLSLVALGDSIASGDESASGDSYVEYYGDLVAKRTGRAVGVKNLADPTETSASLLDKLRSGGAVRAAVADADIVTITIGGNDGDPFAASGAGACAVEVDASRCLSEYAPGLEANLDGILAEVMMLRGGSPTVVRVTSPDYDPFVGVSSIAGLPPIPKDFGTGFYRRVATAMTAAACRAARAHAAACVDFFHIFNGPRGDRPATPYLADDHLHPSERGRRAIADALMTAGLAPLD